MWFFGVEVEQETSAPPPKKILDPPLHLSLSSKMSPVQALSSGMRRDSSICRLTDRQ